MRINNRQSGFTIIESLVAFLVLTLSLAPMLAMANLSSSISNSIKNNLIGSMLAQEGIEIVRALRDENWLNGRSFDYNLPGTSIAQWDSGALIPTSPDSIPYIKLDPSTNKYNYDTGEDTIFKRKIYVYSVSSSEIMVQSIVTYQNRFSDKTITVEDHLYDWY